MPQQQDEFAQYVRKPTTSAAPPADAFSQFARTPTATNTSPPVEDKGFLTEAPQDKGHPIMSALAQEGLGDLNEAEAKAKFGQEHPWITAIGDTLSTFPSMIPSLSEHLATQGFTSTLRASLGAMAKRAAVGGGTGAAVGGIFGGKTGAKIGAVTGAISGGVSGYGEVPLTVEQEAEKIVEKQIAVRAARVRAGIDPPVEDTIAELLRKEFLEPEKVAAKVPKPSKTIGQRADELNLLKETERVQKEQLPTGQFEDIFKGPTGLSHQVARQHALEDIRNATINRPGWTAKLPDRITFKKLSPIQQRTLIQQAITSDPQAVAAVRSSARIGSAGDLASWSTEELWARFMKEYQSEKPNEPFKQSLANEISRRGQAKAAPMQVRP